MAADASIFAQYLKPPRSVREYQDEGDQRTLSRLKLLLGQQEVQQKQQGFADEQAFRSAASQYGADQPGLINALRSKGLHGKAQGIEASIADLAAKNAKTGMDVAHAKNYDANTGKTAEETKYLKATRYAQKLSSVRTPQDVAAYIDGGIQEGILPVEMREKAMQELGQYATVDEWRAANEMEAIPVLERFKTAAENSRNEANNKNRVLTTGMTNQTSRDTNAATIAGQAVQGAANRGVQMRGQNMTDSRARELNETTKSLGNQEKELRIQEMQGKLDEKARGKDASISSIGSQIGVIDKALNHPGRETATGFSGAADPRNYVWGTDAKDFKTVLDQIGGAAFLQAFESLRGGGAITEIEGKKATDAMARLNRAQSDKEFKSSLDELRGVMTTGYKRLSGKDYAGQPAAPKSGGGPKPIKNDADYNALPSGAEFVGPDGKTRRKP